MIPPRNRSPKSTAPRKQLVLRLSQIRCSECGASANVKYLRPFLTYQTEDGFVIQCRHCAGIPLPPPRKVEDVPAATAQAQAPELASESPARAA